MIPTIIHQVFFTRHLKKNNAYTIPKTWKKYRQTFKKLHPHWQHMLWSYDNALPFIQAHYPKWLEFFRDIPLLVAQADIIRYMLLWKFGGWYFDLDCEALQAIDSFANHEVLLPLEFSLAFGDTHDQIGNAILASRPQHPLWEKLLTRIWHHRHEIQVLTESNKERVIALTGPTMVHHTFHELDKTIKAHCTVLKREHFHMPFKHPLTHTEYKKLRKNSEIFALHHSYSTWRSTNIKSLFRRKAIARNRLLHALSKLWVFIKSKKKRR